MDLTFRSFLWLPLSILAVWTGFGQALQEGPQQNDGAFSYREDQFYIGVNYNVLGNVPSEVAVRGLSGGMSLGFIRDFSLLPKGNLAVGLGLGFSFDRYGQNIKITQQADMSAETFEILTSPAAIDQNRLNIGAIEIPIELRWRTSTAQEYKFWRIYSGIKLSYGIWEQSYFRGPEGSARISNWSVIESSQLFYTLSFGYGTFNAQLQYGLRSFFPESTEKTSGASIGATPIKLGMVFYLL
ncbi:MAG: outer membrane beta-barrel protein [Flavobacteriaceae bacterium]|jgi:hypothetical protein|nr:outer membrane beta-barrel protein [Flavobacteriaceae bacterium]MDG1962760.1 outer membrane beta-barrel protein [Flavobacteriaceae bacterium]